MLLPRVLRLGYAFLSSDALATVAQPLPARAAADLGQSCSLGIRDGDEVSYLARADASRIMSLALRVACRLPPYCTSVGRVLRVHASERKSAVSGKRGSVRLALGGHRGNKQIKQNT